MPCRAWFREWKERNRAMTCHGVHNARVCRAAPCRTSWETTGRGGMARATTIVGEGKGQRCDAEELCNT
eukprot:4753119-Pyramimonas_sp.AAC.1